MLPGLPTGAIAATFVSVNRESVLLFVVAICCCFGAAAAVGFVGVVCCGVVDDTAADDVDGSADDNAGDFIVFGIPHILDSVVLTKSSFDNGLLGSHIAAFCSGVNDDDVDVLPSSDPGLLQSVQILLK